MNTFAAPAETPKSVAASRSLLITVAWIATLLMSKFTILIGKEVLGVDTSNAHWLWIGVGVAAFALTLVWTAIKPLRGYFLIMAVVLAVTTAFDPLVRGTVTGLIVAAFDNAEMAALFGDRLLLFGYALLVIIALLLMGQERESIFLGRGQLDAAAEGVTLPGRRKPVSWTVLGLFIVIVLGGLFATFMATVIPPSLNALTLALPLLPLVLLSAALNAFGEEVLFRAAPLSQLWHVVGRTQALFLTAVFFGFGHYYGGIPSGPFGFVQTGGLALLLGKAMLETRGMLLPWFIHFALDTIIYLFIAMAAVTTTA